MALHSRRCYKHGAPNGAFRRPLSLGANRAPGALSDASASQARCRYLSGLAFAFSPQSSQQTTTTALFLSFTVLPPFLISQPQTGHFLDFMRCPFLWLYALPGAFSGPG